MKSVENKRQHYRLENLKHIVFLVAADCFLMIVSMVAALWLRYNFSWDAVPKAVISYWVSFCPVYLIVSVVLLFVFRMYSIIWRMASFSEVPRIVSGILCASAVTTGLNLFGPWKIPMVVMVLASVFNVILLSTYRYFFRFHQFLRNLLDKKTRIRTMIIGAGGTGQLVAREILGSQNMRYKLCCFVDDNPTKWGKYLSGVLVAGGREDIPLLANREKVELIILAIPGLMPSERREILKICQNTNCKVKLVPNLQQMLDGDFRISKTRDVQVEDLLGRDPIHINMDEVFRDLTGKVIMVTGGGGSIGSELCRQIADHKPRKLVVVDIYENNAYDLQMDLQRKHPELDLDVCIASVRDQPRMEQLFKKYHPEYVYHAAAHKHVPLMEDSPNEAIKNNVFGTLKTALCADRYGTKRFVLISTDKAVNPTNLMGASKRLCEMIVQSINRHSKTEFVAVRFGNVLGSNGSVVPLFKKQIEAGGPVTVTHPDIIRFFMTIPEAVSLVLEAGAYAKGGEIFVLDMGEPVKIDDLARNLIRLSGLIPDVDIEIQYTGLRPGEKLYEEVLVEEEGLQETANRLIHIGKPLEIDEELFSRQLEMLQKACQENADNIKELMEQVVPTYHRKKEECAVS